ncbi:diacylglycerol kinase family protein [Cellulomonas sp. NPDC089187]|uniref:diacylglycerol/lipid kinase family protein n=1 Tax=Cellulomonas sp. NPDC089187 TaxID=3154970 RepID=UPI00342C2B09
MSHLGVVVNPVAGKGRGNGAGQRALAALRDRGHRVEDLTARDLLTATAQARRAAVDGLDALVVVGGDGLVHLGAQVVAETRLPLGIVSAGTGNDVARALGLPLRDLDAQIAAVEHGLDDPRAIDAVRVGPPQHSAREWYLGALSCGVDAAVNARANAMTWPRGAARYVRALVAELSAFRPYGYRVTTDEGVWESAGTVVVAANGPWIGGGVKIAPDALIDDGLLDVVIAGPFTKAGVVRIFPGMYSGRHVKHPNVQVTRTRRLLVEAVPGLGATAPDAHADGERIGPLPLEAVVEPGAVLALV